MGRAWPGHLRRDIFGARHAVFGETGRRPAILIVRHCAHAFRRPGVRRRTILWMALLAWLGSERISVAVTEPNGLALPQPPPSTESSMAASVNSEIRLDRLVVARGEAFDTVLDAYVP